MPIPAARRSTTSSGYHGENPSASVASPTAAAPATITRLRPSIPRTMPAGRSIAIVPNPAAPMASPIRLKDTSKDCR